MSLSCLTQLGNTHVLSFTPQSLVLSLVYLLKAKTDQASSQALSIGRGGGGVGGGIVDLKATLMQQELTI